MTKDFTVAGVVGRIILDTRRARKDGKFPAKIRITYNRESVYFKLGYNYTEKDFNRLEKTRDADLIAERGQLEAELGAFKSIVTDIVTNGNEYSHNKLNTRIRRGKTEDILEYIEQKAKDMEAEQPGNASIYRGTKEFLKKHVGDKLAFREVSSKLLDTLQETALKDIRQTTLAIYLRTLRSVYNDAINEGIINESGYPFSRKKDDKRYRIKPGIGTKTALNASQMAKIVAYQIPEKMKALRRSRDLFLLQFHMGGISIVDLMLLKWSNVKNNQISYERKKTIRTVSEPMVIRVPMTKTIQSYLDAYGTEDQHPDNYILPFMVSAKNNSDIRRISQNYTRIMNKHLKKIAKDLELPHISTYVSRHSWSTISKNSGANESFIKEQLGHRSLTTTQNYLKSFEDQHRTDHFEMIEQIIQSNGIESNKL